MKAVNYKFLLPFLVLFFANNLLFSQAEADKPMYLTATTMHWNANLDNFSQDEWKAVEKEYFDKVVMKNEFIKGSNVAIHYFTADNTEIIFVYVYENWDAIKKAQDRFEELEKQAWPDEKKRTAFFEKRESYYDGHHSDEIYATLPGAKMMPKIADKQMVYYLRKSSFAKPKDGSEKEFNELNKQLFDAVINKNEFIKAYYPHRHAWGSNSTDFLEVFVVESLGDIEKAFKRDDELFKAQWKDEKSQKEFDKKMGKYFHKTHSDYIYRSVVGLEK
ncbi:MAG TPA: hypothetical protein VLB74_08145 [Flavobacterium sp.]|uniref:hypothetical protein n=1 Tax=Flavobacterium sp. TaxID=239 RepID=UPI002CCA0764|nr:hypothetical protein [Flavobacterium sp.]HSD14605.1 hypothetical protein [Flavobacterium sp.]